MAVDAAQSPAEKRPTLENLDPATQPVQVSQRIAGQIRTAGTYCNSVNVASPR